MRHTVMQLRAHEDGLAILAVLAKELHIAEAIPHGDFEDFAANKSFSDLSHGASLSRCAWQGGCSRHSCGPRPTL